MEDRDILEAISRVDEILSSYFSKKDEDGEDRDMEEILDDVWEGVKDLEDYFKSLLEKRGENK